MIEVSLLLPFTIVKLLHIHNLQPSERPSEFTNVRGACVDVFRKLKTVCRFHTFCEILDGVFCTQLLEEVDFIPK